MSQISHTSRLKHFEELSLFLWSMNIFMHFFVLLFLDWCHMHAWYWMCSTIPGHFNELLSKLIVYKTLFFVFFIFKKGTRWRKYWCKTMFTTPMNKSTRTKCFLTMSPHYFWEWRVLEIIKKGTLESGFTFYLKVYGTAIFSYIFCERKVFFNCSYSLWILQTVRPGFAVYFYISE